MASMGTRQLAVPAVLPPAMIGTSLLTFACMSRLVTKASCRAASAVAVFLCLQFRALHLVLSFTSQGAAWALLIMSCMSSMCLLTNCEQSTFLASSSYTQLSQGQAVRGLRSPDTYEQRMCAQAIGSSSQCCGV